MIAGFLPEPFARWRRELDWRLQNRFTWSAPVLRRGLRSRAVLLGRLTEAGRARHAELAARYDLSPWDRACGVAEFRYSLYLLDLLDRHLGAAEGGRGLDIGASAWGYLPGQAAWSGGPWDGVELDAHRRYLTGVTRRGYGEWMAARFPGCRYRAGSLLELDGEYRTITWLLPLVTPGRNAAHRLPPRFFQPRELLHHAWALLAPGGRLLVVNQGEEEAEAQRRLFDGCGIAAEPLGELASPLSPFRYPRLGWRARKGAEITPPPPPV